MENEDLEGEIVKPMLFRYELRFLSAKFKWLLITIRSSWVQNRARSSAYMSEWTGRGRQVFNKAMYKLNRMGLRIDPCSPRDENLCWSGIPAENAIR